jgi:hypothetical protein
MCRDDQGSNDDHILVIFLFYFFVQSRVPFQICDYSVFFIIFKNFLSTSKLVNKSKADDSTAIFK